MSSGTSIGDIISLVQLAHRSYRNCKQAGGQYLGIAREVRSLHSVVSSVRDGAKNADSAISQADATTAANLKSTTDGCRSVLEGVDALLAKHHGLSEDGAEVGATKKFCHRWNFGAELDEVVKFRWKIISCTSTLAVLMDSINLKATDRVEKTAGRVENKVEAGFNRIMDRLEGFEDMRKAVLYIATKARASERYGSIASVNSVLSLSTYPDDDKEVWRQFRRELISIGFRSDSLDRHMEVLNAYMTKLEKTGVLDEAVAQSGASYQSWCMNKSFRLTTTSLQAIKEDDDASFENLPAEQSSPRINTSQDVNIVEDPQITIKDLEGMLLRTVTNKIVPTAPLHQHEDGEIVIKLPKGRCGAEHSPAGDTKIDRKDIGQGDKMKTVNKGSPDFDSPSKSTMSPASSRRRRVPRTKEQQSMPKPGQNVLPAQIRAPVQSPLSILINEGPPAYSEFDTHPSLPLVEGRNDITSRDDMTEAKREGSEVILDSPQRLGSINVNSTSAIQNNGIQDHPNLTRRPPQPYAESYYSASEAASSQITLLRPVGELRRTRSNTSASLLEKKHPGEAWSRSDSSSSAVGSKPQASQVVEKTNDREDRTRKWIESVQTETVGIHHDQVNEIHSVTHLSSDKMPSNRAAPPVSRDYASKSHPDLLETQDRPRPTCSLRVSRYLADLKASPRLASSGQREKENEKFTPNSQSGGGRIHGDGSHRSQRRSLSPLHRHSPPIKIQRSAQAGLLAGAAEALAYHSGRPIQDINNNNNNNSYKFQSRALSPSDWGSTTYIQKLAKGGLLAGGVEAMAYHFGRHIQSESNYSHQPRRPKYRTSSASLEDEGPNKSRQSAKAALVAGATEAFRERNEPGSWWTEEKGKQILTAAIGAGGIDAGADRDSDKKSTRPLLETIMGGLAASRIVKGPTKAPTRAYSSDEEIERKKKEIEKHMLEAAFTELGIANNDAVKTPSDHKQRHQYSSGRDDSAGEGSPDRKIKLHVLEAIIGGLVRNRVINGPWKSEESGTPVYSSDDEDRQKKRQERRRRN